VKKRLKNLKADKSMGPDKISPRLLKELAEELGEIVRRIFQESIDNGTVV